VTTNMIDSHVLFPIETSSEHNEIERTDGLGFSTNPYNVDRRYSEFVTLREVLIS